MAPVAAAKTYQLKIFKDNLVHIIVTDKDVRFVWTDSTKKRRKRELNGKVVGVLPGERRELLKL